MHVGTSGRRVCGTGRQSDQSTSSHSGRTRRHIHPTKHRTPNPDLHKDGIRAVYRHIGLTRYKSIKKSASSGLGVSASYRQPVNSPSGTIRSGCILAAVSTALFCVQIDYFAINLALPRMAMDLR